MTFQEQNCPFFPCTFPEQSCKHCYCPLYPCRILETGGFWIVTKTGHRLWDCSNCKTIHLQEVVELLDLDKNEDDDEKLRIAKQKLIKYLNKPKLYMMKAVDSKTIDKEIIDKIEKGKFIE